MPSRSPSRRLATPLPALLLLSALGWASGARIAHHRSTKSSATGARRQVSDIASLLEQKEEQKVSEVVEVHKRKDDKASQSHATSAAAAEHVLHARAVQSSTHAAAQQSSTNAVQSRLSAFSPGKAGYVALGLCALLMLCGCCCCAQGKGKASTDDKPGKHAPLFDDMPGNRNSHAHDGHVIYEWDQTDSVATIYIKVPPNVTQNDLDIRITERGLQVGRRGKPPFLNEETFDDVNEQESSWQLHGRCCQVTLAKVNTEEWPHVLLHTRETRRWLSFPSFTS